MDVKHTNAIGRILGVIFCINFFVKYLCTTCCILFCATWTIYAYYCVWQVHPPRPSDIQVSKKVSCVACDMKWVTFNIWPVCVMVFVSYIMYKVYVMFFLFCFYKFAWLMTDPSTANSWYTPVHCNVMVNYNNVIKTSLYMVVELTTWWRKVTLETRYFKPDCN